MSYNKIVISDIERFVWVKTHFIDNQQKLINVILIGLSSVYEIQLV